MSKGYGARTEAETKAALATVAKAEKAGIRTVQLQFVDLHGITKSVQIPIHQMPGSIKHGTWFDGSSVEGFTRIAESDQSTAATRLAILVPFTVRTHSKSGASSPLALR